MCLCFCINAFFNMTLCHGKGGFHVKGGYLDFSHLTELKNIYVTGICMKKQCKSSISKNHKITKKKWMVFP